MFYGRKEVNIGESRRVHILNGMKKNLVERQEYRVYLDGEWDNGTHRLIFRFDDEPDTCETFVKSYKIPKNLTLKVPPQVYCQMKGKCILAGATTCVELIKEECYNKLNSEASETVLKLAEELGLI